MSAHTALSRRERLTVSRMIRIACAARHGSRRGLCPDCADLESYAHARIDRCRFGDAKPVCALCPVHCYRPAERGRIRELMRFAGPRMLLRHPALALLHLLHRARGVRGAQAASGALRTPGPSRPSRL